MDGCAAARAIRRTCAHNAATPILAVTAMVDRARRSECAEAGMNEWLDKPSNAPSFYAKVRQWLSKKALEAPAPSSG